MAGQAIEILRPHELCADDLAAWTALKARDAFAARPFLGPAFARAVSASRPDALVAVAREADAPVAFLAHQRSASGLARPIGAPFNDAHGLIAGADVEIDVPRLLAAAGLAAWSYTGLVDPDGRFAGARTGDAAWIAEIGADGAAYVKALKSKAAKFHRNLGRFARRAEAELGPLELTLIDRSPEALVAVIAWKRAQYLRTGRHDVLGPDWARAMLARLVGDGDAVVSTLRAGGRLIAGDLSLVDGAAAASWITAFDPELGRVAPGLLLTARRLAELPSIGVALCDFGPGHAAYKKHFANARAPLMEGVAFAASPAGRARHALNGLARGAEGLAPRIAGRARRRFDQIAAAEPSLSGRLAGGWSALTRSSAPGS